MEWTGRMKRKKRVTSGMTCMKIKKKGTTMTRRNKKKGWMTRKIKKIEQLLLLALLQTMYKAHVPPPTLHFAPSARILKCSLSCIHLLSSLRMDNTLDAILQQIKPCPSK